MPTATSAFSSRAVTLGWVLRASHGHQRPAHVREQVEKVITAIRPASTQTLKAGIERIMKDRVDDVTEVVEINALGMSESPLQL